ncbi:ribose 5-phosphate isomerase B [candidate division CSSED10-310 bacterium]|uniref:Ribose 5-phosphate isomerase B n=1 Tax=candidate division CSSED10-310 bacterium TaxID=2855610 RepID=A0ABV6YSW2_UNCC1
MKLALGADHAGFRLKEHLKKCLEPAHHVFDVGTHSEKSCDYPIFAHKVCQLILSGQAHKGILICGTGIGMSIVGNRYSKLRTALCHNEFTAERARLHNDAQIIALGAEIIDPVMALKMIEIFLNTKFDGEDKVNQRHLKRLQLINSVTENS